MHVYGFLESNKGLKVVSATFLLVCFLSLKESSCETRKNVSYFTGLVVKALDSQSRGPVFKTAGWLQGRLSLSSSRGR